MICKGWEATRALVRPDKIPDAVVGECPLRVKRTFSIFRAKPVDLHQEERIERSAAWQANGDIPAIDFKASLDGISRFSGSQCR